MKFATPSISKSAVHPHIIAKEMGSQKEIFATSAKFCGTSIHCRRSPQKEWKEFIHDVVFALNTSYSKAIKCIPFRVVFGRNPILPEDMFLGVNEKYEFRDVTTPNDYAEELKIRSKLIYEQVNTQLEITRTHMQAQYNNKLNFNDYKVGDQAWLKKKYYKTGENRKLSPRRTGPWTIVDKMPNGVNFRVRNNSSGQTPNCSP